MAIIGLFVSNSIKSFTNRIFKTICDKFLYRIFFRRKRDKLSHQLEEAHLLRDRSNKRQVKVEDILSRELGDQVLHTFRIYISRREELLRSQRACEEAERSILPAVTTV